jgi:CubicO group peptidase (beta-lactamase class C family)
MQLVENGKSWRTYFKIFDKLPKTWENITVKQIVTHKSGLPEIWDSQGNCYQNSETLFKKNKRFLF